MNYKNINQYAIPCNDKPGTLGLLCETFGKAKINVTGITTYSMGDVAYVRFFTNEKNNLVETALKNAGYTWFVNQAWVVELPNVPGELGKFCKYVGNEGVNIHNVYGISEGQTQNAKLIFSVDNTVKFEQLLKTAFASKN